jgi:hypothetical protein
MKKRFSILLLILLITGCSKQEEKFELFSPEAFAYSLDNSWELNASCQAKGFVKNENNGKFASQISFVIDLKLPDGNVTKNIQRGRVDQFVEEDAMDLTINTQIKLDSTYKAGTYIIIFNAKDDFSGRKAEIERQFEL